MAPAKLYYFKGRGRSQQSRWVLAASSIAFLIDVDAAQRFIYAIVEVLISKTRYVGIEITH